MDVDAGGTISTRLIGYAAAQSFAPNRIADYSVLDLYRWSTEQARQLWHADLKGFAQTRRERIVKDKRRYWRLQQGEGPPRPFLCYVHLAARAARNADLRDAIVRLREEEACAALAIVAAVAVTLPSELVAEGSD